MVRNSKERNREVIIDTIQGKRQVANEVIGVNEVKIQNYLDEEVVCHAWYTNFGQPSDGLIC
mgnify:CR=1 FL=1